MAVAPMTHGAMPAPVIAGARADPHGPMRAPTMAEARVDPYGAVSNFSHR